MAALTDAFSPPASPCLWVCLVPLVVVFFFMFAPSPSVLVSVLLPVVLLVFLRRVANWVPAVYSGRVLVPTLVLVSQVIVGCQVPALLAIPHVVLFRLTDSCGPVLEDYPLNSFLEVFRLV